MRWTPLDLLEMSDHCADAAFLNMVHILASAGLGGQVPQPTAADAEWSLCASTRGHRRSSSEEATVVEQNGLSAYTIGQREFQLFSIGEAELPARCQRELQLFPTGEAELPARCH